MRANEPLFSASSISEADARALVTGIHAIWGLDFREHDLTALRRRAGSFLAREALPDVARLLARLLVDPGCLDRLVRSFTSPVTAMFRDPGLYSALRELVVPVLRGLPYMRVWIAGCSTGEEAYSLAILLEEEGLYARSRIYATDVNASALERARQGVFPLHVMRGYTRNYLRAGGKADFSSYYATDEHHAALAAGLRRNVVFARHDLTRDRSFHEFHLVLCRNVMIYFNDALRERVAALLGECVIPGGYLVLGNSESTRGSSIEPGFEPLHPRERLFRKREAS